MLYYLTFIDDNDEKQKFEQLYHTYRLKMQYTAFCILKDEQEAENMVHDTFVTLTDHLDAIVDVESPRTWNYIVTILKNKCFNFQKKQGRLVLSGDSAILEEQSGKYTARSAPGSDPAADLIRRETSDLLAQCIRKLDYPYQEVICLYYYNELNSHEIGRILELSPANVRQILKRAKNKLKNLLSAAGYQNEK